MWGKFQGRLPPELLKITNTQPRPHTQKVPAQDCVRVMESENAGKTSTIPSRDAPAPKPLRPTAASGSAVSTQREAGLVLIRLSTPHPPRLPPSW